MTALSIRLNESTDALLRFAVRADAILTGLAGVAALPLAGWLADTSGTTKTFEYAMAAFFIAYGLAVLGLAALPSLKTAGMAVIVANIVYAVAAVVLVVSNVFPLTTIGVTLTLATGVYTLAFAELQYQGWRRLGGR
jgi:hypothetical protein